MPSAVTILDRYILRQTIGTLCSVLAIVMSLMILEHLPRLIELTRLAGHRGTIVMETFVALLPEYGGLGLLVGLYFAIALAVRKLSLRGELDAIEASGIAPSRWMRWQGVLTLVVALVILVNQGWLTPWGEQRLDEIGRRMDAGEFGYNVQPNEMIVLGESKALTFRAASSDRISLEDVFLVTGDATYTAASGHISIGPHGGIVVRLVNGQSVRVADRSVANFDDLEFFEKGQPIIEAAVDPKAAFKEVSLVDLARQGTPAARAAAYGRVLWAVLALMTPAIALLLGRPPNRSSAAFSLLFGLLAIVLLIKSISLVENPSGIPPELSAAGLAACWLAGVIGLARWIRRSGAGAIDELILRLVRHWPSTMQLSSPGRSGHRWRALHHRRNALSG